MICAVHGLTVFLVVHVPMPRPADDPNHPHEQSGWLIFAEVLYWVWLAFPLSYRSLAARHERGFEALFAKGLVAWLLSSPIMLVYLMVTFMPT